VAFDRNAKFFGGKHRFIHPVIVDDLPDPDYPSDFRPINYKRFRNGVPDQAFIDELRALMESYQSGEWR
jgi:hypothetical protein